MAIRNLIRLFGQILGIIALILFVPPAIALFMLYDVVRWLFAQPERDAAKPSRRQVPSPVWGTGARHG